MFRFARAKTTQNVFGDLFNVRLADREDPRPVGRRGSEHDAVIVIGPHRRCPPARKILGILCPFRTKPPGPKNNEILGGTIIMARDGETAFVGLVGNRCAVAFVPDQGVIRSEDVAVAQTGTLENPVIGMLHLIADGFALAPPLAADQI